MQNVNRNVPVFIHVCDQMGLTDPFLNRDEYGQSHGAENYCPNCGAVMDGWKKQ